MTHVGMKATGVYWHPVHAALEHAFTVIVGNASHMCNVPGRKTAVKDAEWIADLIRHGLVRASFVSVPEVRALRGLVRHRKAVVGNQASERNRTLQLLESANIKLASVISDVFGVSSMLMLQAMADGNAAPVEMANLAKCRLRRKVVNSPWRLTDTWPSTSTCRSVCTSAGSWRSTATWPTSRARSAPPCVRSRLSRPALPRSPASTT